MDHSQMSPEEHAAHKKSIWGKVALGVAILAGLIILAPYILPALGVGSGDLALEALTALHAGGLGTGIVGAINTGINAIPLIGPVLAKGGLISAVTTGIIGIGGMVWGRNLEKNAKSTSGKRTGKFIHYASMVASITLGLPSILTGISMGLVYLAAAFSGSALASSAVTGLSGTVGSMGAMNVTTLGLSGAVAALPHLLTCGASIFPALFSIRAARNSSTKQSQEVSPTHEMHMAHTKNISGTQSVSATVLMDAPLSPGMECRGKVILTDEKTGQPVTSEELAVVHTKKLHLFVVDSSLSDYHHLHPQPTGTPGEYSFSFTPHSSNAYSAWSDVTLLRDGSNYKVKSELPSASLLEIPPHIRPNNVAKKSGMRFEWKSNIPLEEGKPAIIEIQVKDERGQSVTDLEPVMGTYGHLVGFGADGNSIIHTHPLESDKANTMPLRFHIVPDSEQPIQFYLHIKRHGETMYVPFGQQVQKAKSAVERFVLPRQQAGMNFSFLPH